MATAAKSRKNASSKKSTSKSKSSKPIRMKKDDTVVESTATAAPVKEKKTRAPKAEKPAKPVINIISALYGVEGTTIEVKDNMKVGRKITNKLAGSDPAPKVKKQLQVVAEIDGERVERTFAEGEILKF